MKTKTLLAALLLLAISCKKENSTIQPSSGTDKSSAQADINASVGSVTIGTQVWMKKDLTRSHYRNGDSIPEVRDPKKWAALSTGAWCWYNNKKVYGKLYNWYALNDPRGLAPEGWHVPSYAEWTTLINFLGGEAVAGGKMKETGTTHWLAPNTDATNSSGFTGLPGGIRDYNGSFNGVGLYGYWWSSTEYYSPSAWFRDLVNYSGGIGGFTTYKQAGFSVRCIKD